GRPLHYATAQCLGGRAVGLLVTAYEGHPTKVEGNPDHPSSLGATGVFEQASILQLYDPQRASVLQLKGLMRSWREFLAAQLTRATPLRAKSARARIRLLLETNSSAPVGGPRARIRRWGPDAGVLRFRGVCGAEDGVGAWS